jgi:hypothetical protein
VNRLVILVRQRLHREMLGAPSGSPARRARSVVVEHPFIVVVAIAGDTAPREVFVP